MSQYSISYICDRFKIDRRTLNRRLNKLRELGFELEIKSEKGKNFFSEEGWEILCEADEHLKTPGATLNNFVPVSKAIAENISSVAPVETPLITDEKLYLIIQAIGQAVARMIKYNQELTPYQKKLELSKCAEQNFLLTSKEVLFYTGKQPVSCRTDSKGDRYYPYGNFRFYKLRSNGANWRVNKVESRN
jgi:hypothetical protein